MKIINHYWKPLLAVEREQAARCADHELVVDVGGGRHVFAAAQQSCGWNADHRVDLNYQPLPYADQQVDFLYCRHTLEDLANPAHLLREIERVAQRGYIETPSPLAELTRGVDAGYSLHRGYRHHRWLLWSAGGVLYVLPKYPFVENMHELDFSADLAAGPQLWNTHHAWEGRLMWKVLEHERDFNLSEQDVRWWGPSHVQYEQLLHESVSRCRATNAEFFAEREAAVV